MMQGKSRIRRKKKENIWCRDTKEENGEEKDRRK